MSIICSITFFFVYHFQQAAVVLQGGKVSQHNIAQNILWYAFIIFCGRVTHSCHPVYTLVKIKTSYALCFVTTKRHSLIPSISDPGRSQTRREGQVQSLALPYSSIFTMKSFQPTQHGLNIFRKARNSKKEYRHHSQSRYTKISRHVLEEQLKVSLACGEFTMPTKLKSMKDLQGLNSLAQDRETYRSVTDTIKKWAQKKISKSERNLGQVSARPRRLSIYPYAEMLGCPSSSNHRCCKAIV